jgi:dTDP-4-dehydrorhamnose 3,5-epimerase-like enzyme
MRRLPYARGRGRGGVNDPDIGITWPCASPVLSKKDSAARSLKEYLENPAFRY